MKLSVVIPHRQRLPYIERTLAALFDQDLDRSAYEVVIGCLEHSRALAELLAAAPFGASVRCVMSGEPWRVSRARNLALGRPRGT